jgi:hypothetical protein
MCNKRTRITVRWVSIGVELLMQMMRYVFPIGKHFFADGKNVLKVLLNTSSNTDVYHDVIN